MKLEEIEKLCEEATPGPWKSVDGGINFTPPSTGLPLRIINDPLLLSTHCNLKFIAASRELMPRLIALALEVKNLRQYETSGNPTFDKLHQILEELEKD